MNVEFKYDNLRLMKDNVTEKEYVDERREFLNNRNKGEGDNWLEKWEGARETFWEPKFLDLMRRTVTESKGIAFQKDAPQVAYTLIVDAQDISRMGCLGNETKSQSNYCTQFCRNK